MPRPKQSLFRARLAAFNQMAKVFPTEDALRDYLKKHPKANPKRHTVKGQGDKKEKSESKKDLGSLSDDERKDLADKAGSGGGMHFAPKKNDDIGPSAAKILNGGTGKRFSGRYMERMFQPGAVADAKKSEAAWKEKSSASKQSRALLETAHAAFVEAAAQTPEIRDNFSKEEISQMGRAMAVALHSEVDKKRGKETKEKTDKAKDTKRRYGPSSTPKRKVRPRRRASTKTAGSVGRRIFFELVDRKKLYGEGLRMADEPTKKLLRRVMEEMMNQLTPPNNRFEFALNRLNNAIEKPISPENFANQIFKVADELGIKP